MATFPRRFPRRGEVYDVDFNPARGSEQAGVRPALIVSNDVNNEHASVVIVLALTSQAPKKPYPFVIAVPAGELPLDSWVMCNQVMTVSKERLERHRATLDAPTMAAIAGGICVSLGVR